MNATWSLGVLVGLPILVVIIVASLVASIYGTKKLKASKGARLFGDDDLWIVLKWGGRIIAAVFILVAAFGYYPYSAQYHRWEPTTGTVDAVSKRLVGDGKGMEEKVVVEFSDGRERGCNDTRCALIRAGDRVTLTCKRTWQFAGTDGWDCNFVLRGGSR